MICRRCHTYFCWVSWGSEADTCECGANEPDDPRDRSDREPTEDELEERRQRNRGEQR